MKLPVCPQAAPYPVTVEKDQVYAWCTCGLSQRQPFCDGAHRGTEMRSLKHCAQENATVYYCGCKQTKTPPFCDGSHKNIEATDE